MAEKTASETVKQIAIARLALYKSIKSLEMSSNIDLTWRFITNKYMADRIEIALKLEDKSKHYIVREIITKHGEQSWAYKLPEKKYAGGYFYNYRFIFADEKEVEQKLQSAITNIITSMLSVMQDFGACLDYMK